MPQYFSQQPKRVERLICMFYAVALSFFSSILSAQGSTPIIGVLGDSFALGAGAHPALSLDYAKLWKVVTAETSMHAPADERLNRFGISGDPERPQVLWPGIREYYGDTDWFYANLTSAFTQTFLNTPQYGWSYLVGRRLQAEPGRILIAADNGAKIRNLTRQVDRLLDAGKNQLPAMIFVLFSSNDLCAPHMNAITTSEEFGESLRRGLEYMARNGKAHPEGTRVYVPAFLNMSQLISSDSILSHSVIAYGEKSTCRDLRKNNFQSPSPPHVETLPPEALYLSAILPPNYVSKCPTLFGHRYLAQGQVSLLSHFNIKKKNQELVHLTSDYISQIATRIRNYRQQTEKVVQNANAWIVKQYPKAKLSFHYLPQTAEVNFEGDDMAPDCFHFSLNGQAKIADAILKGIEH